MSVFSAKNNWLSSAKRIAKEGLLQAMGSSITTEDLEFDTKLKNFNAHVNDLLKLKQTMEVWLDSFEVFCSSSQILCETWKTFHTRSPYKPPSSQGSVSPFQDVATEVDKVMTDIHLHLQPAIHDIFKNRCLKPINFVLSLVPNIQEQIQQRKVLLLEFDSNKQKFEKEHAAGRDSSHPNVAKKAVKLDESAKKLYALQTAISKMLDEFELARPLTMGPELAAFVACLHSFSGFTYNSTSSLLPAIPQAVSTLAILDNQVSVSKLYTDRLTSLSKTVAQQQTLGVPTKTLDIVEPVSVRPPVMGGAVGGYGESLHVETPLHVVNSPLRALPQFHAEPEPYFPTSSSKETFQLAKIEENSDFLDEDAFQMQESQEQSPVDTLEMSEIEEPFSCSLQLQDTPSVDEVDSSPSSRYEPAEAENPASVVSEEAQAEAEAQIISVSPQTHTPVAENPILSSTPPPATHPIPPPKPPRRRTADHNDVDPAAPSEKEFLNEQIKDTV